MRLLSHTTLFQSTPPRGRRHKTSSGTSLTIKVSIHASAREATYSGLGEAGYTARFNPRLRAGGDMKRYDFDVDIYGFNPRLRAGGDDWVLVFIPWFAHVSIHASAREATSRHTGFRLLDNVSIHASAREATAFPPSMVQSISRFNPRLRAGGDSLSNIRTTAFPSFNPRLRAGGDGCRTGIIGWCLKFQSTPPRGRRP